MDLVLFVSFLICLLGCAHGKPNYKDKEPLQKNSRITIYWPRQWQSQWAEFAITINGVKIKQILNEGFVEVEIPPGITIIQTHHFQRKDYLVYTELDAKEGTNYYFKLDTEPLEVTALGVIGDVLSISTVVAGLKSELKLKSNQGTWSDLYNAMQKDDVLASNQAQSKEKDTLGHHVLVATMENNAIMELKNCCSSERVEDFR